MDFIALIKIELFVNENQPSLEKIRTRREQNIRCFVCYPTRYEKSHAFSKLKANECSSKIQASEDFF
jgi:hypothetical protein